MSQAGERPESPSASAAAAFAAHLARLRAMTPMERMLEALRLGERNRRMAAALKAADGTPRPLPPPRR